MRSFAATFLFLPALVPMTAHAQSQANGTQQLINELQGKQEPERQSEAQVTSEGTSQKSFAPDLGEIQLGSIMVSDTEGKMRPEFGPVIERFIGTTTAQGGLQDIATAVAAEARARGFLFASAFIPEQEISLGNLRVIVDLGRIDDVEISGDPNKRLSKMLSALKGEYARKDLVERKLLLARDIPGVLIDSTDFVRDNGRGKLIVRTKKQRASAYVAVDNYGDSATGPYRARLEVDYTGIIDLDDRISASVTATPLQPDELTFVSARYSRLLGSNGTQIWVTGAAGRTHDGVAIGDWRSRSRYVALGISTPVKRSMQASLWLNAELAFQDVDQSSTLAPSLEDHVTTLSLSASGNIKLAGGRLSGGLTAVQGLDLFGATHEGDPASSRTDGSAVFTKEQLWLNWFGLLGSGFSMRLAGNGQLASRPLLASQEIGLGGNGYGRAYSYYELSGDKGAMGLFELRHATDNPAKFIDWVQFYGFFDGGYVGNLRGGFGSGSLMSGGGGIRSGFGRAELGLELAVPVDDARMETQDKSPRVNFTLGYRF